jgi:hypothetical protein
MEVVFFPKRPAADSRQRMSSGLFLLRLAAAISHSEYALFLGLQEKI